MRRNESLRRLIQKKHWPIFWGLVCLLLCLLFQWVRVPGINSFLQRVDYFIYDNMVYFGAPKSPPASNVVIINIDQYSILREGRWPWSRDKLALLLENLKKAGVVVVAFDIVMSEPEVNYALGLKDKIVDLRDINTPVKEKLLPLLSEISPEIDGDNHFARVLKQSDVILGYLFLHNKFVDKGAIPKPLSVNYSPFTQLSTLNVESFEGYSGILPLFLQAAPHAGFVSVTPDDDGVIRHGLLLANYNHQLYASSTLSTVMRYLLTDQVKLKGGKKLTGISVGGIFVPMNRQGEVLIPFWGLPGTMNYYSASDVLRNKLPPNALAGTIALVGSTLVLLGDVHPSPVRDAFFGIEMNANIITGILGQHIRSEFDWHSIQGLLITTSIGAIAALSWPFMGPIGLTFLYLMTLIVLFFVSFMVFSYMQLYFTIANLLIMLTLQFINNFSYSFILEHYQKNKIRMLFGQYVPPSYVDELTELEVDAHMQGETRDMTVFFADIRNFTTISESLEPGEVIRLLNDFFTPITNIIFAHQGTIDKYVGDMIMAFWGAPIEDMQHHEHALNAALNIKTQLVEINQSLAKNNLPNVNIGMGLASGMMNVGDMGSEFRRSYTVIGDTVNLASRLEELTKFYQVEIIVSEATYKNQPAYIWRVIDKVRVKGRNHSLMIYEPLGHQQDLTEALVTELQSYEQALQAYYAQDWKEAKRLFSKLSSQYPALYLYQLYLERIKNFMRHPPEADWDGTYAHSHK